MNEAEQQLIGRFMKGAAKLQQEIDDMGLGNPDKLEIKRLEAENARLRELLLWKSKRVVRRHVNRGHWREENSLWSDEEIDKELRNGTGKTD